jgi:4'-phosphopantetheinyl transferase EntD
MTTSSSEPADSVSSLARLFAPWPVVVEELRDSRDLPTLHPDEAAQVADAAPQRQLEFAQARACARRALAQFDVQAFALLNGPDRAPRWPAGIVGSITHTVRPALTYAAVVVGRSTDVLAVGVDAEASQGLEAALQSYVLTVGEQERLAAAEPERQPLLAKIIFSAKEAFYKAQFPLSARKLGFQDVEVALDLRQSTFQVRLTARAPTDLPLVRCQGRYAVDEHLVLTGIVVCPS